MVSKHQCGRVDIGAYLKPFAPFFFPLPVSFPVPFPVSSNPSIFDFFFPDSALMVDMAHFQEFQVIEEVEMGGEPSRLWPLWVVGALECMFASIGDFNGVVRGVDECWVGVEVEVRTWERFG